MVRGRPWNVHIKGAGFDSGAFSIALGGFGETAGIGFKFPGDRFHRHHGRFRRWRFSVRLRCWRLSARFRCQRFSRR